MFVDLAKILWDFFNWLDKTLDEAFCPVCRSKWFDAEGWAKWYIRYSIVIWWRIPLFILGYYLTNNIYVAILFGLSTLIIKKLL